MYRRRKHGGSGGARPQTLKGMGAYCPRRIIILSLIMNNSKQVNAPRQQELQRGDRSLRPQYWACIRNAVCGDFYLVSSTLLMQQNVHTLSSYEAEMDEMVVMDSLVLEDYLDGKETLEPLDHRDLLDPGVVGSLM